jgi:hypothetical protein
MGGLDGPNAITEKASRLKIAPTDKPMRDIFIPLSLREFHACSHSSPDKRSHPSPFNSARVKSLLSEFALYTVFGVLAGDEHPAADMVSWISRVFDEFSNFGVDSEEPPLLALPA